MHHIPSHIIQPKSLFSHHILTIFFEIKLSNIFTHCSFSNKRRLSLSSTADRCEPAVLLRWRQQPQLWLGRQRWPRRRHHLLAQHVCTTVPAIWASAAAGAACMPAAWPALIWESEGHWTLMVLICPFPLRHLQARRRREAGAGRRRWASGAGRQQVMRAGTTSPSPNPRSVCPLRLEIARLWEEVLRFRFVPLGTPRASGDHSPCGTLWLANCMVVEKCLLWASALSALGRPC
jgi:hypothetical protein